jgi:hypothetical protein
VGASLHAESTLNTLCRLVNEKKIRNQGGRSLIAEYTAKEELGKAAAVVWAKLATDPVNSGLFYLPCRLYPDLAGKTMLTLAMVAPKRAAMYRMMAHRLAQ